MHPLLRIALAVLLCPACTGPSAAPPAPSQIHASPTAPQSHYRLHLQLEASPATGYAWSFVGPLPPTLAMESDPGLLPSHAVRPGAGTIQSWTFRAERAGHSTLRFIYGHPWDRYPLAEAQRDVKVVVE